MALAAGIVRAGSRHWSDAAVALGTLTAVALALLPPLSPGCVVAANAALVIWLARGWGKKKFTLK